MRYYQLMGARHGMWSGDTHIIWNSRSISYSFYEAALYQADFFLNLYYFTNNQAKFTHDLNFNISIFINQAKAAPVKLHGKG